MGSQIKLVENNLSPETHTEENSEQKLLFIENDHYLSQAFLINDTKPYYQTTKVRIDDVLCQKLNRYLVENRPNMIVLNIGFPPTKQLSIIRDIREIYDGLLVIVSSNDNEQEQIDAFKLDVDDFIVKPVNSQVLMMRIKSLFRRQKAQLHLDDLASLTMGDVCLKPKSQKCFINGSGVKLTTFEFNLLKSLVEHQGNILSRDELYSTLLRRAYNGVERTLDVRMSQLREKLTVAGMKDNQIETVWGQGYMFNHISA